MKANELMIGDWVLKDMNYLEDDPMYTRLDYQPYQIMTGDEIDVAIETNCIGDADVYQPIPLTVEILLTNGFEKKGHRYGIYDDYFDFEMYEYNDGTWLVSYHCCEMSLPDEQVLIFHVHQLQHFMRHCGIEKEIVVR